MDITLTRILSLLPKKDDGAFVRGAKKDFAVSIGYDSGDIVSMWIKGTSQSYLGKLHEIASKYNVSVEWLKGETDEKGIKKDLPQGEVELTDAQKEAWELVKSWDDEKLKRFIAAAKAMLGE